MNTSNKDILTASFSKKDRKNLWIPEHFLSLENLHVHKVLSWVHRSGHLGFVVLNIDNKLSGIILERRQMQKNAKVCMCDWCLSVYPNSQIAQFSFRKDKNTMIGHYICCDLNCEKKILSPDSNNVHSMRETLSKEERIDRYYSNVKRFWDTQYFHLLMWSTRPEMAA